MRKRLRPAKIKVQEKITKATAWARRPEVISEISKLTVEQAKKILPQLRRAYTRRVGLIKKSGEFSPALDKAENLLIRHPYNKLTRNQMIHELYVYQQFFSSVTSSLEGIRQLNVSTSRRIFGNDRIMTQAESKAYWDLYDEFLKYYQRDITHLTSNQIQRRLGRELYNSVDMDGMMDYYTNMDAMLNGQLNIDKFLHSLRDSLLDEDIRGIHINEVPDFTGSFE